jgi:signal peptidase II
VGRQRAAGSGQPGTILPGFERCQLPAASHTPQSLIEWSLVNRRNVIFLLVAVFGIALDQATKAWIMANIEVGTPGITVIPGLLSIVHAHNPGAAFGLLSTFAYRHQIFLVLTLVAVVVIVDLVRKLPPTDRLMSVSLGLIAAGAIGNVIDRLRFSFVVDFIRVYTDHPTLSRWLIELFGRNEWPTFNVADSALVVGVGLFVIHQLVYERKKEKAVPAAPAAEDVPTDPSELRRT